MKAMILKKLGSISENKAPLELSRFTGSCTRRERDFDQGLSLRGMPYRIRRN